MRCNNIRSYVFNGLLQVISDRLLYCCASIGKNKHNRQQTKDGRVYRSVTIPEAMTNTGAEIFCHVGRGLCNEA